LNELLSGAPPPLARERTAIADWPRIIIELSISLAEAKSFNSPKHSRKRAAMHDLIIS